MKKIIIAILSAFLVQCQCFAMQMSQPTRIGSVYGGAKYVGKLPVEGASFIILEEKQGGKTFIKSQGGARFGNGENALWLNYLGKKDISFGSADIKKSIMGMNIEEANAYIYRITTDIGITLYAVNELSDVGSNWALLGYVGNNSFVKYFDTKNITKEYFTAKGNKELKFYYYGNYEHFRSAIPPFDVNGDTIKINLAITKKCDPSVPAIYQFRFKWDNQAKWFGIEKYDL